MDEVKLAAKDVAELIALKKLETLGLSKAGIDDEAASHLAKIGTLTSLTIQEAAITDEGSQAAREAEKLAGPRTVQDGDYGPRRG